jgi:hypothetical protein
MKDLKGFEGLYKIDENGSIYSSRIKKIMKVRKSNSGYMCVILKKDNKYKGLFIHRLLAINFIDNPLNLEQVNHIDGDKLNNSIENLEWCTRSHNMKHMYDIGLKTYKPLHYKGKFGSEHNRSKSVYCVTNNTTYGSMSEASRELKMSVSLIYLAIKNNKLAKGMHFEYGLPI